MKFFNDAIQAFQTFVNKLFGNMRKAKHAFVEEAAVKIPSTIAVMSLMVDTTAEKEWEADSRAKITTIDLLMYLSTQPVSLVSERAVLTRPEEGRFRAVSVITFKVLTTRAMGTVSGALELSKSIRVSSVSFEPLPMATEHGRRLATGLAFNKALAHAKIDAQKAGVESPRPIHVDVAPCPVPVERTRRKIRRAKKPMALLPTKQDRKTIAVKVTATFEW